MCKHFTQTDMLKTCPPLLNTSCGKIVAHILIWMTRFQNESILTVLLFATEYKKFKALILIF